MPQWQEKQNCLPGMFGKVSQDSMIMALLQILSFP